MTTQPIAARKAVSSTADGEESYDATTDPRTGRPPLPIDAEKLNQARELQQLRNAQLSEGEEDFVETETDDAEIDVTLEDDDDADVSDLTNDQAPGRMASPQNENDSDEDENR